MTPADRYLAAARPLVDLDLPALAARLCPTGICGVAPEDVPAAVERLSTCEMAAAAIIRAAWGLPDPEPYVAESAPRILDILTAGTPHAVFKIGDHGALRRATLDAPPTVGCAVWFGPANGHPEHVDAAIVDCEQDGDRLVYSAVAGGQPPAPGMPGSWAVRLVARTLRWDGSAWVDEGTGRRVMACIDPGLLDKMYGGAG